jgi:hypothetical protein
VSEDQVWIGVSSGGGGYGYPWERDPELVAQNVRDGFYSAERAEQTYRVLLNPDFTVDAKATRKLRASVATGQTNAVTPNCPSASSWRTTNMRDGDEYVLDPQ